MIECQKPPDGASAHRENRLLPLGVDLGCREGTSGSQGREKYGPRHEGYSA